MISTVLSAYGFREDDTHVQPFGTGLINNTWKVTFLNKTYILQRINQAVFKQPLDIAGNLRLLSDYFTHYHPEYKFVAPVVSEHGYEMVFIKGQGFFRLFPFIEGSHTIDVVEKPGQAYEAAVQFGRFTCLLSGIDLSAFRITIPSFHDLSLRQFQFIEALKNGNKERIHKSKEFIRIISDHAGIVKVYEKIKTDPAFRLRIIHHDTKISNVLFDQKGKGICVIDLDTAMPGYFISDVGDMMRTYLSPVSEEESDVDKIEVREDFYRAIVQGYQDEMKDELTETEKNYFLYAGKFMIYMQGLRYLTDYINDDTYYPGKYPGHNYTRANNQLVLLQRLLEKESLLQDMLKFG
jgi:Ser/Thr protein kinase RdoA (MazF antagonist)